MPQLPLNRRTFLVLGGLIAAAPSAFAGGHINFPLRAAYARLGPAGFASIRTEEQAQWSALQSRTGALIQTLEPLQPTSILGQSAPDLDGGASCALAARAMASEAGFDHVILYAIDDGRAKKQGWIGDCFASLRKQSHDKKSALGEAHLLFVGGGTPLLSATADASPRGLLSHRSPARETLDGLISGLEKRITDAARSDFEAQRSIAD